MLIMFGLEESCARWHTHPYAFPGVLIKAVFLFLQIGGTLAGSESKWSIKENTIILPEPQTWVLTPGSVLQLPVTLWNDYTMTTEGVPGPRSWYDDVTAVLKDMSNNTVMEGFRFTKVPGVTGNSGEVQAIVLEADNGPWKDQMPHFFSGLLYIVSNYEDPSSPEPDEESPCLQISIKVVNA